MAGAQKQSLRNHDHQLSLPDDFFFSHILPLLPIIDVVRLRCVSKTWYTFLNDKLFLHDHCRRHRQIMMRTSKTFSAMSHSGFNSIEFDDTSPNLPIAIHRHKPEFPGLPKIIGACHGYILLDKSIGDRRRKRHFMLWNPTTRATFDLPVCRILPEPMERVVMLSGFGYDPISHDYKVLVKVRNQEFPQIYTRKMNAWKIIAQDIPDSYIRPTECQGVFASGFLHWSIVIGNKYAIMSFDLAKEKFKFVPLHVNMAKCYKFSTYSLDGLLCVVGSVKRVEQRYWDIWVMKEYGVNESWTTLMTIPYASLRNRIQPLCFTQYGEVIVELCELDKSEIVSYDPKAKSGKDQFKTLVYLGRQQSLVSVLFGDRM